MNSATFKIWALDSAGSGGAAGHGHDASIDVERLNLERETQFAIDDALLGRNPIALPAGEYDTVLEAPAVAPGVRLGKSVRKRQDQGQADRVLLTLLDPAPDWVSGFPERRSTSSRTRWVSTASRHLSIATASRASACR